MIEKNFLLDTNICVFLLRGKKEVIDKIKEVGIGSCAISEISIAELYYGVECAGDDKSQLNLLESFFKSIDVIPISSSLKTYAIQKAFLRREGKLIDDMDLLIGSSAISNNLILVTDNKKHFERLPVKIENWVNREK